VRPSWRQLRQSGNKISTARSGAAASFDKLDGRSVVKARSNIEWPTLARLGSRQENREERVVMAEGIKTPSRANDFAFCRNCSYFVLASAASLL
jgi:hypothetical protein